MRQAEWLEAPFTKAIVEALGADNVKFVGGAVRDTLLGWDVADVDAATRHEPQKTTLLLENSGIKVIPTGLKHGTVTAVSDKQTMEITTLRVDVETDGRHAEVAFTEDWLADAKRRDFTINAIYLEPGGRLFDPLHGGDDLQVGMVRFIGTANDRIEEDTLRILRFFRFFGRYGKGEPDAKALAACTAKKHLLAKLSIERVRDELLKIIALQNVTHVVAQMLQCGVLEEIFGQNFRVNGFEQFIRHEKHCDAPVDQMLRFHVLARSVFNARELAEKFKLSNNDRQFLCGFEKAREEKCFCDEQGIRRFIYCYGTRITLALAISEDKKLYDVSAQLCETWTIPIMPVGGQDLLNLGNEPGAALGLQLKELESQWIASDFLLSRQELLGLAQ